MRQHSNSTRGRGMRRLGRTVTSALVAYVTMTMAVIVLGVGGEARGFALLAAVIAGGLWGWRRG